MCLIIFLYDAFFILVFFSFYFLFFFFQAEDGIRDGRVTGVQTCALPICAAESELGLLTCMRTSKPRNRIHDAQKGDRAECRRDEDGHDCPMWPQSAADERHQRHIAQAHCLLLQRDLTQPADDRDHPRSRAGSDERLVWTGEQRRLAQEERQDRGVQRPSQSEQGEPVRNEVCLRVRERHAEQHRSEHSDPYRGESRTEGQDGSEPAQGDRELTDEVHRRDWLRAAATARAQYEPAHQWNVLIPREAVATFRTT